MKYYIRLFDCTSAVTGTIVQMEYDINDAGEYTALAVRMWVVSNGVCTAEVKDIHRDARRFFAANFLKLLEMDKQETNNKHDAPEQD